METIAEFVRHRHRAKEAMETILKSAKSYNIPDAQLREILQKEWNKLQLSQRTFLLYLPSHLKNQNMVRKRPKKDPLVKNWDVELDLDKFRTALQKVLESGQKKAYVTHDNKRVVDIGLYD